MKRILCLFFGVICLGACSVDHQELDNPDTLIGDLNATYVSDGCTVTTFDYGDLGNLEVRNDRDYLYIFIQAEGENSLTATSLHVADAFSGFPIVGKGNLKLERMEYQESFSPGVKQHSYRFPLSEYNEKLVIASYTTFNGIESVWAGDIAVKQGNWAYFDYQVKEHPVNAGLDGYKTITVSEATALPSWDEVRKVYAEMLAPGIDRKSGTYNPTIWELINDFNDPTKASKVGEYTTTYTLGSGDCIDSVQLTMKVVPDVAVLEDIF